jgi:cell wall-associated NlpC family hydrolase
MPRYLSQTMIRPLILFCLLVVTSSLQAQVPDRASYKSPYSIKLSFDVKDLVGDLYQGKRADPKQQSSADYKDWYDAANQRRWTYWGPPSRHYPAPAGLNEKKAQWKRERVIAAGMTMVGKGYQHHHIPDWDPPAEWPSEPNKKRPVAKGLDCSNFVAFAYNLALGFKLPSAVGTLGAMTEAPGPGEGKTTPVQRIELPTDYAAVPKLLRTGDILCMKNKDGDITHAVLWVGDMGKSPKDEPLVLDSTGDSGIDANGTQIPDGIYLRAFRTTGFYFKQASHAIRVIPDDAK